MKIGISTASFKLKQETENAVQTIKSLGADCAEVCLQTFYEYRPEFAKQIAPHICGFEVHSVQDYPPNFEPQLFTDSRRIRGDGYYWLDQIMRSAQLLGAKNYTFRGLAPNGLKHGDIDALSAHMQGVIGFCARYGVSVCLENWANGLYNRPYIFGEFKARCSELRGVFSMNQARKSGYPYAMYLKDMSGVISHAHLTDYGADGKPCLPGEGVTDFNELFKRLKDVGFDGAVLVESDCFDGVGSLKRSLEFLRETADKVY